MGNCPYQKIRLLKVYQMLQHHSDENHPLSTANIIERLGQQGIYATRKTIYNDIAELNEHGYYVETVKSKTNSYYLDDRQFDQAEINVLMNSVRASHFLSENTTNNLLNKLAELESVNNGKQLLRNCYTMGESKTLNKSVIYSISAIDTAITNNHQITFIYTRYNDKCKLVPKGNGRYYLANPIKLLNSDNNYYLIANHHNSSDLRVYRLDRMLNVNETTCSRDSFDERVLHDMQSKMFSMHIGKETQCVLEMDPIMTNIIVDRFGTDVKFVPADDGKLRVTVSAYMSAPFVAWCIQYGLLLKVVSPASLVHDVKLLMSELNGIYS